jgi:hypothetical protein
MRKISGASAPTQGERYLMAYTLEQALPYLWDGANIKARDRHVDPRETYVCHAVSAAFERGHATYIGSSNTKDYIRSLLGRHLTVDCWLIFEKQIPVWAGHNESISNRKRIQAYRKAWMKHMIKELRK